MAVPARKLRSQIAIRFSAILSTAGTAAMLRLCTGMRSLGAVMPCKKGLQVPPPPAAVVAAAGAGTGAEQKGTEQK